MKQLQIHKRITIKALMRFLPLGLIAMAVSGLLHAEEDEDDNTGAARLETKTDLNSADCIINDKDREEDRKRKNVGAGEIVEIILKGKPGLIGDVSSIKWSLEGSEQYASFLGKTDEQRKVKIQIKKQLSAAEGKVKVKVTSDQLDEPVTTELTAIRPKRFEVENQNKPLDQYTREGDTDNFGTSTRLKLTVNPIEVSFVNISILEENNDDRPNSQTSPSLFEPHNPGVGAHPDSENSLFDHIGFPATPVQSVVGDPPRHKLPQTFTWKSNWIVDEGFDEERFVIQESEQVFDIRFLTGERHVKTTITKFGCSVSRTTEYGNRQQYK